MTGKREDGIVQGDMVLGDQPSPERQMHQTASNLSDATDSLRGTVSEPQQTWVTVTFIDRDSAVRAYNLILSRGYSETEISLMMSDITREHYFSNEKETNLEPGNKALESIGVGSGIGVTTGVILASLIAVGTTITIPVLGLFITGPIASALAGAGAGGLTGGIIGALIGWGIPEKQATLYEADLKNGNIVLGVIPHNNEDADYFEGEWKNYNGRNIYR